MTDLAQDWLNRALTAVVLDDTDAPPAWTLACYDAAEQFLIEEHGAALRRADRLLRHPLSWPMGRRWSVEAAAIVVATDRLRRMRSEYLTAQAALLLAAQTKEPTKGAG